MKLTESQAELLREIEDSFFELMPKQAKDIIDNIIIYPDKDNNVVLYTKGSEDNAGNPIKNLYVDSKVLKEISMYFNNLSALFGAIENMTGIFPIVDSPVDKDNISNMITKGMNLFKSIYKTVSDDTEEE